MTRAEACEYIATVMNEWFPGGDYTLDGIAQQLDEIEKDEANAEDSDMWYPVLAMEILKRAGLVA